MVIRTYCWHGTVQGPLERRARRLLDRPAKLRFRIGNAGDIVVHPLITHLWGEPSVAVLGEGHRLLLVGSTVHVGMTGDVVAGVGTKGDPIPHARDAQLRIVGVRGPLTAEALVAHGHDLTGMRFMGDPGLLIRDLVEPAAPEPGRVIFIPHYRERADHWSAPPKGIDVVDIDADPLDLAREIQRAEAVYSSSLHGVIFAQALGRPCVLVAPASEPMIKYKDHYAAFDLPMPTPLRSIHQWQTHPLPGSPVDLGISDDHFTFPTLEELRAWGVATSP